CGLFLALSCQVKIIPLLLLPIVFFFWFANYAAVRFAASFLLFCLTMWAEPLVKFPALFVRNVFVYGSYWGVWGITYCLRLTGYKDLNGTGAFNLPFAAAASALLLKVVIVIAVLLLAWRRRNLGRKAVINSIAYAWIIFFVLSPGICVQYLVWLAPFILLPPQASAPGGLLHPIAALHPQPAFAKVGFDEGLYREYVNALIKDGITSYPDIVEGYIEVQTKLPGSILPPVRFLYIFSAY